MLNIKDKIYIFFDRLKRIKGSNHDIAIGVSSGIFVGITPTIPFHTAFSLIMADFFKGSKRAAIVGIWISNPLTVSILYLDSYKIGSLLLKKMELLNRIKVVTVYDMLQVGIDVSISMILGGFLLGIIPAFISYFVARWFLLLIKN